MYFRSQKKTLSDVYISDTIDTDKDGNNLTLLDLIADETNIMEDVDLKLQSEKVRILVGRCLTPVSYTHLGYFDNSIYYQLGS